PPRAADTPPAPSTRWLLRGREVGRSWMLRRADSTRLRRPYRGLYRRTVTRAHTPFSGPKHALAGGVAAGARLLRLAHRIDHRGAGRRHAADPPDLDVAPAFL